MTNYQSALNGSTVHKYFVRKLSFAAFSKQIISNDYILRSSYILCNYFDVQFSEKISKFSKSRQKFKCFNLEWEKKLP